MSESKYEYNNVDGGGDAPAPGQGGGMGAAALFKLVTTKQRAQKAKKPVIVSLLDSMDFNFVQQLEQNVVVYTLHSALIILSVVAYVAETSPEFASVPAAMWVWAELVFTVLFTVEVVMRYFGHLQNNSAFWTDPLIWVDLASIAPFVVVFIMCEARPWDTDHCNARNLWYIKVLQALKMLRVFKVSRHFAGTKILISTFEQSMRALRAPFVFLFVSVTIFASLMYFLESGQWNKEAQAYLEEGGESPTFSSVLDAAYFVCVTMTTVGYGDQSPASSMGKGLAIVMMIFGVLFTAMPLTIVGNEFYGAIEKEGGFQYLLDAEQLADQDDGPKVITFEAVSHQFVLVGSAVTRLNRYVDRVTHDPSNPTETDYENEKHVLTLLREWVKRHIKFMYTLRVLTTPDFHDRERYLAWKRRVKRLGFQRSYSQKTIMPLNVGAPAQQAQGAGKRRIVELSSGAQPELPDPQALEPQDTSFRHQLYLLLDVPDSSKAASLWANIIFALIIVTIIAFTMENQIGSNMNAAPDADRLLGFFVLGAIVNTIFTVELVLRIFVTKDLNAFCLNLFNVFDFLAIVPFYLTVLFKFDAIPLRLVRMLRIFKLSSRIEGTQVVMEALRASLRSLLIPLYMLIVITLIFGAALFLTESGTPVIAADGQQVFVHDDGSPSEVTGILRAGWVIIVTMTTVGYGDITPVTFLGRVVCVIAMLFGTLYMAMPIAIVGNNFWKAYETLMKRKASQDPANKARQEVVQLPPTHQITFELAVDSGRKLARAVAMMDRRIRKLRKVFKDPEVAGPSAAIIAARMLDAMTDGADPTVLAETGSSRAVGATTPAGRAAAAANDRARATSGASVRSVVVSAGSDKGVQGGLSEAKEMVSPAHSVASLSGLQLDSSAPAGSPLAAAIRTPTGRGGRLPKLAPLHQPDPLTSAANGDSARGTPSPASSFGFGPTGLPVAGNVADAMDERLLRHASGFSQASAVPESMTYGAANTTTGVGLVRVVTATYLDHLLSLSEVLSYLHEALELRELKRSRTGHISLDTARKAEEMFQRVIRRQKRITQAKRMREHLQGLQGAASNANPVSHA